MGKYFHKFSLEIVAYLMSISIPFLAQLCYNQIYNSQNMKLLINGYFLAKPKTGMGQYITQILLAQQWPLELIIVLPDYLQAHLTEISPSLKPYIRLVKTFYNRNDLLAQMIWEFFLIPQQAKLYQADIVWSSYPSISQIPSIKHVMVVHDVIYWRYPEYLFNWRMKVYALLLKSAIHKASKITTISHFSATEIEKIFHIPARQIPIIPPASPRQLTDNQAKSKILSADYVFYTGGLDRRKNVTGLIKAFDSIQSSFPKLKLYIAGHYFKTKLIPNLPELIQQYQLEDKVVLLGYISDQDLVAYIQSAKLLVYPSFYEGFGIPILEGMSLQTPVITSNLGAMAEVAGSGAYLVDPYSVESIAQAMQAILSDEMLQQSLIHKGYEQAKKFSWQASAQSLGQIFLTD